MLVFTKIGSIFALPKHHQAVEKKPRRIYAVIFFTHKREKHNHHGGGYRKARDALA